MSGDLAVESTAAPSSTSPAHEYHPDCASCGFASRAQGRIANFCKAGPPGHNTEAAPICLCIASM